MGVRDRIDEGRWDRPSDRRSERSDEVRDTLRRVLSDTRRNGPRLTDGDRVGFLRRHAGKLLFLVAVVVFLGLGLLVLLVVAIVALWDVLVALLEDFLPLLGESGD